MPTIAVPAAAVPTHGLVPTVTPVPAIASPAATPVQATATCVPATAPSGVSTSSVSMACLDRTSNDYRQDGCGGDE
jgi:hypothetical protein